MTPMVDQAWQSAERLGGARFSLPVMYDYVHRDSYYLKLFCTFEQLFELFRKMEKKLKKILMNSLRICR